MAKRPDLSKYLDTGAQFVALTRAQARARAKELVSTGQLAQGQVQGFVDDLVEDSRRRTDEMLGVVRSEIQRQMTSVGIATKDDLARLEARVAAGSAAPKSPKKKPAATKKSTKNAAKKKAAKKKAAKKKAAKKKTVKKSKKSAGGAASGPS